MNPIERGLRRIDKAQQRHKPAAFIVGVVKKYGDDNGGMLASSLAHSAFVSVFPLLLILVTILGLIVSGDQTIRQEVLKAIAHQFPQIGTELTSNIHVLRRSSMIGLIVGLLTLVWGATGLAQSGLFTMEQVWNLPGPARPGFVPRLGRAMLFIGVLFIGVVVTTLLTALPSFGHLLLVSVVLADALAAAANIGLYFIAFRVLTPRACRARNFSSARSSAAIGWTALQALGNYLVSHYLHSDSVYGYFGTVLGLVTWLYFARAGHRLRRRG